MFIADSMDPIIRITMTMLDKVNGSLTFGNSLEFDHLGLLFLVGGPSLGLGFEDHAPFGPEDFRGWSTFDGDFDLQLLTRFHFNRLHRLEIDLRGHCLEAGGGR